MKLIKYPSKEQWAELLKRPALNTESLFDTVRSIIDKVKAEGDKAVLEYEAAFDKVTLSALAVSPKEIQAAGALVSDDLKVSISLAKQNIETFHSSQRISTLACASSAVPFGEGAVFYFFTVLNQIDMAVILSPNYCLNHQYKIEMLMVPIYQTE